MNKIILKYLASKAINEMQKSEVTLKWVLHVIKPAKHNFKLKLLKISSHSSHSHDSINTSCMKYPYRVAAVDYFLFQVFEE